MVVLLIVASCASEEKDVRSKKEKQLFEEGTQALAKNNYRIADERYTELLKAFPTTPTLPSSLYNLGLAYEGQKKYAEAIEEYRKVAELYQKSRSRDEADALYRMSICFEVLGQDQKVIFSLLQLEQNHQYLRRQAAVTEVYARLAAAYARLGQVERSEYYYSKAEVGLKNVKRVQAVGDA